jgi:hypothetical protein
MQWDKLENEHNFGMLVWFNSIKINAIGLSLMNTINFIKMNKSGRIWKTMPYILRCHAQIRLGGGGSKISIIFLRTVHPHNLIQGSSKQKMRYKTIMAVNIKITVS